MASIHWPLIRTLISSPLRTRIVDETRSYRGVDLLVASLIIADDIERRCTTRTVGVMLPTTGVTPAALLATWTLGKVAVPLNYLLKREELQYVIDDCETDTIVTVRPMLEFMGYTPRCKNIILLEDLPFKSVPSPRWPALNDDQDLAILLYTSGTSGKPKGVMLSHANITSNIRQIRTWIPFGPDEVFLGCLPQFHSFGLTALTMLPLMCGCKVVYAPKFIPHRIVRLFREHRPTVFIAIPSMFNALLHVKDASADDFKSLRFAVSGGEPLPDVIIKSFKDRFNVTIAEGYGLTETSPVSNWCRPDEYKPHSVGRPMPEMTQKIISIENGQELGPNQDGEVRMRGPNIMQGYFKLPDATSAAFDEQGYFRTGDIGRFDSDGHLFITGRLKEMLIIGGENVFPREIEEVINAHPSVKDCGVIGITDPMRGEQPLAFVELKEGETFNAQSILSLCRSKLAGYKVPAEIRHLDALPRNPTGKIMRRELKKMV
jgi:long-chain acyl-CoA synthetase